MYNDRFLPLGIYASNIVIKPNISCSLWQSNQDGHSFYLLFPKVVPINKVKKICRSVKTHKKERRVRCKIVKKNQMELLKIGADRISHLVGVLQQMPEIREESEEFFI